MQKLYCLKLSSIAVLAIFSFGCDSSNHAVSANPVDFSSVVQEASLRGKTNFADDTINGVIDITPDLCDLSSALAKLEQFTDLERPSFCPQKRYSIGDIGPSGGVVFHVSDDGLHGLEAPGGWTTEHINIGGGLSDGQYAFYLSWRKCQQYVFDSPATDASVGAGAGNTQAMLAGCGADGSPADYASDYTHRVYEDWSLVSESGRWHLPSKDELSLAFKVENQQRWSPKGMTLLGKHWSSTIDGEGKVWSQQITIKDISEKQFKRDALRVRLIKSF